MKKIVFCYLSNSVEPKVYTSTDYSIPISDNEYRYPITAFLDKTADSHIDYKFVIMAKAKMKKEIEDLKDEISGIMSKYQMKCTIFPCLIPEVKKDAYNKSLLLSLINLCEDNASLYADITFATNEEQALMFSAFEFAANYMNCKIDKILCLVKNNSINEIKDLSPIACLNIIIPRVIHDSDKSKYILNSIVGESEEYNER